MRTFFKLLFLFVGGHCLFGLALMGVNAVHKINDQDFTFLLAMLFYTLNYSGAWLLKYLAIEVTFEGIFVAAIPQWIALAIIMACVVRLFRGKKLDG